MNLKLIKKLCSYKRKNLKTILKKYLLSKNYKNIIQTDMYMMAEGDLPVCLIAHIDTVFRFLPREFFYDSDKKVLWSPGGAGFDDRAGIYVILSILEAGYKPSIIFTDQEEKGGVGAKYLIKDHPNCWFNDCRALIELDRANKEDCVFYECDNIDFERFIENFGFQSDWGTFSDISIIAPAWGIAAVNLSIGYEDEHTGSERLHCDWCDLTIERVKKILFESKNMQSYVYIPYIYNKYNNFSSIENKSTEEENYYLNQCITCGVHFQNPFDGYIISDFNNFKYRVCDSCYFQYWSNNKN